MKKVIKFYIPIVILIICLLCIIFPYRFILIKRGYPFAEIKKKDILQYTKTDSFRNRGVVISNDKPVGWIYQGMTLGDTCFVPFKNGNPPYDLFDDAAISEEELPKRAVWNLFYFVSCGVILLIISIYFIASLLFTLFKKRG